MRRAGAAFANVVVTAANSVSFQYRAAAGAAAQAIYANGGRLGPDLAEVDADGKCLRCRFLLRRHILE